MTITLDPTVDSTADGVTLADLGRTHFIGIGGAGMSVLAEMLHALGVEVTGSDRESSAKTKRLEDLGIEVAIGQRAENVDGARTVVWSSAIKPDNPEIVAAVEAGARLFHRSDVLELLMKTRRAVTVAGAHGKTTTSAMTATILSVAGTGDLADPSYAIGGSVRTDAGTIDGGHAGSGVALVAEADESDGSFLKYHPEVAVITNVEPDHLDHYGTGEAYREAFVRYSHHATGHVVACGDDEGALSVVKALSADAAARAVVYTTGPAERLGDLNGATVVRIYGEAEEAEASADTDAGAPGMGDERPVERFSILLPAGFAGHAAAEEIPVELRVPGIHNARNATAAIVAAALLGVPVREAARAAGTFVGAARRFDVRGHIDGITIVDDYAHHPTEIAALLDAARRRYPASTLRVLFQPHLFSRTKFFADEFAQALAKADDVIVTGVFPARERQEDFPGVGPATLVDAAAGCGRGVGWIQAVPDLERAAQMLAMRAQSGDVLLTVGAGDVTNAVGTIEHVLHARHASLDAERQ